jgi:hypothetical protein
MTLVDELMQKDRQEEIANGIQRGREIERIILIENLLASGMSLEQVAMATKMTAAEVASKTPFDLNLQITPINEDVTSFNKLKSLSDEQLQDLTGIEISAFAKMLEILMPEHKERKAKGSRCKLSLADQLLIALEYTKGNRSYADVGNSYGISQSSSSVTVKWVKNALSKHPTLALNSHNSSNIDT